MKIVVLYENKKNRSELAEELTKLGHTVETCTSSSDFLEAADAGSIDHLVVDVKSWFRGTAMYNYFDIASKLTETPVVFFDAPEGFAGIDNRPALATDIIIQDRSIDAIVAALS